MRYSPDYSERAGSNLRSFQINLRMHSGHWHIGKISNSQLLVSAEENDRNYSIQGKIKHFLKSYHIFLCQAGGSPVNLCSHFEELRRASSGRCANLLVMVIYSWALVYKTETLPGGISLFQQAARGPKSIYQLVLTSHNPKTSYMAVREPVMISTCRALAWHSTPWAPLGVKDDRPIGDVQCQILPQTSTLPLGCAMPDF